jgi:hypothetical protein
MVTAAISPMPMLRAHKLSMMLMQPVSRSMGQATMMGAMPPAHFDQNHWAELGALQRAVCARLWEQQQDWLDGLAALAEQYAQRREANTLSKCVEREYDCVAQFGALLSNQAVQMAALMENILVDFSYWSAQKRSRPLPAA